MAGIAEQMFHKGDLVRVAKDLGSSMGHFRSDCDAIVIGSYKDQYGGSETEIYTLYLNPGGHCSWYYESQLTLIERGRLDKLDEWKARDEAERIEKSNLDWIFSHGADVLNNKYGASVLALANCFGLTNLWGSHGEGVTYYNNAMMTVRFAAPFLDKSDLGGWLQRCEEIKAILAGGQKSADGKMGELWAE